MTERTPRAYIGSFTSLGGQGITVADADPTTGALRDTGARVPADNPSCLALSPDRGTLYAVRETTNGAVAAFRLTDDAPPALAGDPVPTDGAAPTHLAVTGSRVYTANYTSGSVSGLRLRAGLPTAPATVTRHHGSGPVTSRQQEPHAHGVALSPDGAWLLTADLGTDAVWTCRVLPDGRDGNTPTHRPHGETPLRPGTGPRHLVFHPDGRQLYVVHELEPVVTHCRFDPAQGTLHPLREIPLRPAGTGSAENYPSGLRISADGTRLYAANRGADQIAVLALRPADGAGELLTTVPCGGHWPRDLTLGPDGRWLYVANERSGDVSWFRIGPDGVPEYSGRLPVPAASSVVFG